MFEVGEKRHVELDAALVDVHADALVGRVQQRARLARVDKAAEAVDAVADGVELARVGAGVLHVGRKARLGVYACHAAVQVVKGCVVLVGGDGCGLGVGNGLVDLDGHEAGVHAARAALLGGEPAGALDGVVDGLERGDAHIEVGARHGWQHVVGVGALELGEGVGGAKHRGRLGACGHDLGHGRAREPQVAKDGLVELGAASAKLGKRGLDGRGELRLSGVGRDGLAHAAQKPACVVGRGRGGMAAVRACRDREVDVALLGHAHHGHGLGDAQGRVGCHGAALIEHQVGVDVVLAQPLDGVGGRGRGDLLAVAREVPDVTRGHVALAHEVLGRLEEGRDDVLGVERAAGPDLAVRDVGSERVVLPVLALDGDDVLVSHHDDGVETRVRARPAQQDAEVIDARELGHGKEARVEAPKCGDPLGKDGVISLRDVLARDGGNAQQLAEALDGVVSRLVAACGERRSLCG